MYLFSSKPSLTKSTLAESRVQDLDSYTESESEKKLPSLRKTESESVIESRKIYESANPICNDFDVMSLLVY